MTKEQLAAILAEHKVWREDNTKGKRADLRDAYLRGANLGGANLRGAYLRGANLGGADLRGAYLRDADMYGADLHGAYLRDAYLRGANLGGADLRDAYLRDADLYGAYLRGADLYGVAYVIALGQPNGWWAFAYLWEGSIWVLVGGRTESIADGRAYWADKEDRREVLAALDYAEVVARLRGWEFN